MNRNFLVSLIALILMAPVAAYVMQFGIGFWEKPEEWSHLGGYVGGIYGPILTLLTLSVLCVQIYLQMVQHRQHLVSLQEVQLTEYLCELNNELDKEVDEGITLRSYLIGTYNSLDINALNSIDLNLVNKLNQAHHKLYSMWSGAMACLAYIKTSSNFKGFESAHYPIQKNKIIAYMGPQVCSSLDKHNYSMQLLFKALTGAKSIQNIEYEYWMDKSQP